MKILPVITIPEAHGFQSKYDKRLEEQAAQTEQPEYILSEFLDAKAQEYSEDDVNFAEQYNNLQKVYEDFAQKIIVLQEQINKLKQDPIQRNLKLESHNSNFIQLEKNTEAQNLKIDPDHTGAKKYRDSQQQEQIDILVQQLNELKSNHAEIKKQMIEMVITELKKRDNEEYDFKK
ncbi:hypothetical protein [Pseudoalteromonas sp. B160]|uniref:hypothetical protein n=1 Tax=Pseudoalteromonas sp. B160 TaxID=630414 RepID=UPI00301D02E6